MSYSDLLERMRERDTEAFLELTDRYGWALYNSIRKKHPDKADADKVYHETLQQLWTAMQSRDFDDPMEAILCTLADQIALQKSPRKTVAEIFAPDPEEKPPLLHVRHYEEPEEEETEEKRVSFAGILGAIVLMLVLVLFVWIALGFLMEYEVIGFVDLGYSWLCRMLQQLMTQFGL